jgi:endonuclease-3
MNDPVIPFPTRKVPAAVGRRELAILEKTYPNAVTALDYDSPFTLLVAVMLSAQTTDVRVNLITPFLFAKYPDAASLARADVGDVETLIKSSGFFRTKARNIIRTAQELVEHYHGEVPSDREALEALPGVGRKTASVVVSVAFAGAALAVDTHVFRVSHRLGLTLGKTPREVEDDVTKLVPPEKLRHAHHWLILHGRQICKAPTPLCHQCPVAQLCPSAPIVARVLHAKVKLKNASAPARRDAPAAATRRPARSPSAKKRR